MRIPVFLDYHQTLANLLREHEADIWQWFASDKLVEKAFDENRLTLLKNAVRLDKEGHGELHSAAQAVADMLEINVPITLYQGGDSRRNAALIYIPDEVNIVFEGDFLDILSPPELRYLLGHEMAHFLHKTREDGRYFTADRILSWICGEHGCHQAHQRSLWLSQLYQEIYADRVGYAVCEDRDAAISALIKAISGLKKFSVDGYLKQAREVLALSEEKGSEGVSHPEPYIRAIALDDWATDATAADKSLPVLVEGPVRVDTLDLQGQREVTDLTKRVIAAFLTCEWGMSDDVQAHATSYFPGFEREIPDTPDPLEPLKEASPDVKDYIVSVLLDFATADPDLEDIPLRDAIRFAQKHDLDDEMEKRITKDLKVSKEKQIILRDATAEVGK